MQNSRKITPTGVLILSVDAPRADWLAQRRLGITATDLPAILGLNKYKTAIDVWREKVAPGDDNFEPAIGEAEAAFWGIALEDTVAGKWAEHKGVAVRRVGILHHEDHEWARASLDRLVTGCPDGRCGLEVKTRSVYAANEWDKAVPLDVEAQVKWQLLVSGLDHMHVIALIGGQRLVEHVITYTDADKSLFEVASDVWKSVQAGEAPKLPQQFWTDDYLDQLHESRDGEVEVDLEVNNTLDQYLEVSAQIKDLEKQKSELKTLLVGALGDHEIAKDASGRVLYTFKGAETKRLNSKALSELYPDIAADDRVWSVSTTRTLRTTKGDN